MEGRPELKNHRLASEVAAVFISRLKLAGRYLPQADLNPHEGRLRNSVMPVEYMNIPDYAPADDKTITS
jgi:hypothetical protein